MLIIMTKLLILLTIGVGECSIMYNSANIFEGNGLKFGKSDPVSFSVSTGK